MPRQRSVFPNIIKNIEHVYMRLGDSGKLQEHSFLNVSL